MARKLIIAGATLNQIPFNWDNNLHNIFAAIEEAKKERVDLLCFPELAITGYGCEDLFLSDWLSETAWIKLRQVQAVCNNISVCITLPLRIESSTYNAVCVISNQKILGIHLKQFLARDGVHYEPRWFEAWKSGEQIFIARDGESILTGDIVFQLKGVSFGFEICEDAWRSNRPGYNLYKRKVDLIINPSASHFAFAKNYQREKLVIESSQQFKCVYVYVNHLGNEAGRMIYDGDIIFAQKGQLIGNNQRLSFKPFNILSLAINFDEPQASAIKLTDKPISKFEEFTQAATLALFDYLRKSKAKGFVLSLSGGADSACCLTLVAEMIRRAVNECGWENLYTQLKLDANTCNQDFQKTTTQLITCAYQSTSNSSNQTFEAAKALSEFTGATFYHWSVEDELKTYTSKIEQALGRALTWENDDVALQNIQARTRSPIIWMLANIKAALLITTSNRSEGDVGYATMDGDTSGSLAPLAGVDKTFILQWLKWAETSLGYSALAGVNALTPSAELRPLDKAQTDEQDLMPYDVLLKIEKLALLHRLSPQEVYRSLKKEFDDHALLKTRVTKFFRLWAANQWKRERLAPAFHYDDLNVDPRSWCRFPILSGSFQEELQELERLN
ncbi:MAG TPA: NAD(+) synthase [Cyclobacteriaceae bacterium]|nr:NAD(+) synthase [Cyclobacteriaceae bacterium]